jgi:glycosyltransferase involved in cell wall biosynthesis
MNIGLPVQTTPSPREPRLLFVGRLSREKGVDVLVEAFRRLPPVAAVGLSALAQRLAALGPGVSIDWSDSWSDSDLEEFTKASLGCLM